MSRLEELIETLCPDGVEYHKLIDLFNIKNGYTPSKAKSEYWENGTIPWFRMDDIRENGTILSSASKYVTIDAVKGKPFPENSIIISTSATIGEHALITVPSLANQRFTYLCLKDEYKSLFDIKFIYYYCFKLDEYCKRNLNQGNFASVDMKKFAKFAFPIPPLEVQCEIVRILDNFTELTAELTAELTVRKQQYEYYKNELLSFKDNEVKYQKLGDLCSVKGRIGWQRLKKSEYLTKGDYYLITGVDILSNNRVDFSSCYYVSKERYEMDENIQLQNGDIILTKDGTIGKVALIEDMDKPAVLNSHLFVIRDCSGELNNKFLMYVLLSKGFSNFIQKNQTKGTIPGLTQSVIINYNLPVPTMEIQNKIVDILDQFDSLCNNIAFGIPAEIEDRQRQYEYYRDKLLTFKEKTV